MARELYRSPRTPSAAAAAAPARLAEAHGGRSLWRERADGTLEVAVIHERDLHRHVVSKDGSTSVVESVPPPPFRRLRQLLQFGGFAFCLTVTAAGDRWFGRDLILVLVGMAAIGAGSLMESYESDVRARVQELAGWRGEWHVTAQLDGWAPRTTAQLAAVEDLADRHDGVAHVDAFSASGDPDVEVLVRRWGRLERWRVNSSGYAHPIEAKRPQSAGAAVGAARSLWLPLLVVGAVVAVTPVHNAARTVLIGVLLAACLICSAIALYSWRSGRRLALDAHHLSEESRWHTIRTMEERTVD